MNILVTGSHGFIATNLIQFLSEKQDIQILQYHRKSTEEALTRDVLAADWIIHLAGANRPLHAQDFIDSNITLTEKICHILQTHQKKTPILLSSSIQVERKEMTEYSQSKLNAEEVVMQLHQENHNPIYIYRLANVFGKWSRPNYNSVVATFCHHVIHDLPVNIHDANAEIRLIYIDDVINAFWHLIQGNNTYQHTHFYIEPEYKITVGDLYKLITAFKHSRHTLITDEVGVGLKRALYATYLSFLPPEKFTYTIPQYRDARGVFVEMLKTPSAGQFSYFSAQPGITRGGHYHHSKTEKFLVIRGKALFKFKHVVTGESYQLETDGEHPTIVETVPGWAHDITNIGDDEMFVMLWANELFDREKPDTYAMPTTP
ncbi:UDP-2-acetamido-2,6-beta-L-arabino-hexul-4-ose reductase [Bisgaard Taxon 45]|uniref:NAD-dependent epimerase/dehydratase family protein n=1 Tax=Bisgaard Taxon 45 TaxID=304289 RepID=A0ABT9KEN6_9PAST|nr:NAD-dependent epimerase/dehydratase family protein [Bisgaard Taxon 45]